MLSGEVRVALVRLLFFPGLFFEKRTPRRGVAGRVVAAVAALQAALAVGLTALIAFRLATLADGRDAGDAAGLVRTATVGDAIVVGGLVLVNWLLVSAVLHAAVRVFGGDGAVWDTLYVVGWSTPVTLLSPLLGGAVVLLSTPEAQFWEGVGDQLNTIAGNAFAAGLFATVLVLGWQGYIWVAGLTETHGISRQAASKASAVTAVVVGLLVVLTFAA